MKADTGIVDLTDERRVRFVTNAQNRVVPTKVRIIERRNS